MHILAVYRIGIGAVLCIDEKYLNDSKHVNIVETFMSMNLPLLFNLANSLSDKYECGAVP